MQGAGADGRSTVSAFSRISGGLEKRTNAFRGGAGTGKVEAMKASAIFTLVCKGAAALATSAMLLFPAGSTQAQTQAEIQPHRALYTATLHRATSGGGVSDVSGTMAVSVERACDGWISAQQLIVDISLANGAVAHQEVRYAGWESLDGLSYRFASRQVLAGAEMAIKGSARLSQVGGPGTATFEAPINKTVDLPEGTIFPVSHSRSILEAATAGKKLDTQIVFEGAGVTAAQRVTTFIGAQRKSDAAVVERMGSLVDKPAWPVRMAVFELQSQAAEPSYEIEVLQLANGVARELVLDLGGFTLKLELKSVEAIADPKC